MRLLALGRKSRDGCWCIIYLQDKSQCAKGVLNHGEKMVKFSAVAILGTVMTHILFWVVQGSNRRDALQYGLCIFGPVISPSVFVIETTHTREHILCSQQSSTR